MKFFKNALLAAATLVSAHAMAADKPTIALVHGAFCDFHSWDYVVAQLKADGYHVININLPGRPGTAVSPKDATLDSYRTTVLTAISGEKAPVVLVGHSFGGITISNVGEAAPEKIKTLVYVSAYLPKDGDSLLSLANTDKDSKAGPNLKPNEQAGVLVFNRDGASDAFLNDGSPELRAAFPKLIIDEPLAPLATPVHLTAERFGKIDKAYIRTAKDQVVSPYLQSAMLAATPVRLTQTLDNGHLSLLVNPKALAADIEKAAQ